MKNNRIGTKQVVNVNAVTVKPQRFSEPVDCQCCGRKVSKIHVLFTEHLVGSECALMLDRSDLRRFSKPTKKQAAFFAANGLTWEAA